MLAARSRRRTIDIWPGFVDALAALLMVVIFVLLLFSVGQFLLTDALLGRDQALDSLRNRISGLNEVLAVERKEKEALEIHLAALTSDLQNARSERDDLDARLEEVKQRAASLADEAASIRSELDVAQSTLSEQQASLGRQSEQITALEDERTRLQTSLTESREDAAGQREMVQQGEASIADLNRQIGVLNEQLAKVSRALEISEASLEEKKVEIEDLGQRLNVALADKVEELARYRSEFFGKLREALQDNPDVHIEGDRFVLPSEVLFSSGSSDLDKNGQREIATVARTLKTITGQIPDDVDWVLRVDGHTDRRPIRKTFPSNWELSAARAINIVKYMIARGIPADRLVAAGFAQYHPLDPADTPEAYRRNRRIELKLTSR